MNAAYAKLKDHAEVTVGMYQDLTTRLHGGCYVTDPRAFHTFDRVVSMYVRMHMRSNLLGLDTENEKLLLKMAVLCDTHITPATFHVNGPKLDIATAEAHAATMRVPHVNPGELAEVVRLRRKRPMAVNWKLADSTPVLRVAHALHDLMLAEIAEMGTDEALERLRFELDMRYGKNCAQDKYNALCQAMAGYAKAGWDAWYTKLGTAVPLLSVPCVCK